MAIENRSLTPGTLLTATYKKARYSCTVEAGEEGKLAFVLADGRRFTSLSAAGTAVMNGSACNGWKFWRLDDGTVPAEPAAATKGRKAKVDKLLKKLPNQKGASEGMVKYFCSACMSGFEQPAGEEPSACPTGHRLEDFSA